MRKDTHGTQDYEHVWPPYGVQLAEPDTRTFPDRIMVWCSALEQRIEALEAENVTMEAESAALRHRVRLLEAAEAADAA